MIKKIHFLILIAILILQVSECKSQPSQKSETEEPIFLGIKEKLYSVILKENRELMIYSPVKNSEKQNVHYPLVLVFDAESLFELVVSTSKFMCYSSELPQMPEAIIVGIPNTSRNRDMPVPSAYGNEDEKNFMQFLTTELLPFLNKQYLLNGQNIVVGHSQGGLFVSYLLTQKPNDFSLVLALDAPVNLDPKIDFIKNDISIIILDKKSKARYVSIENTFGWGDEWSRLIPESDNTLRLKYINETHESLPGKGVYEGLKFLFHDFAPPKKDLILSELKEHYSSISTSYGFPNVIPLSVLMGSASRNKMNNRKQEVLDLLQYAEDIYGPSNNITTMKNAATVLTQNGESVMDYYINLPKPTLEEVQSFLGVWKGVQSRKETPPEGITLPHNEESVTLEISIIEGKAILYRVNPPWAFGKKIEQDVFHITKDNELIYGYKNMGSGIILSKARLDNNGNLKGTTQIIGFTLPDEIPEKDKILMQWIQKTPQTFELIKTK